jgi:RNAse (barnase) inhibitor barstar
MDYIKVPKVNVVVLSDDNLTESDYIWLYRSPFVNNLDICWNKLGKDFGDLPIDPIFTNFNLKDTKGFREYDKKRRTYRNRYA